MPQITWCFICSCSCQDCYSVKTTDRSTQRNHLRTPLATILWIYLTQEQKVVGLSFVILGCTRELEVDWHVAVDHSGCIHIRSWQSQNNRVWHVQGAQDARCVLTNPERQIFSVPFPKLHKWGGLALLLPVTKMSCFNQVKEMLRTLARRRQCIQSFGCHECQTWQKYLTKNH